jgi:hypothetical protein
MICLISLDLRTIALNRRGINLNSRLDAAYIGSWSSTPRILF